MKKFVTFEGIDGSGKSTISKMVYEKLREKNKKIILTIEPTDSWYGRKVQKSIQKKTDPYVTTFAFIADRVDHCKKIDKWLEEGFIVLCDRYAESTYAYQGAQIEGEIKNPLKWLKDLSKDVILIPDRTYFFKIKPEEAISRIQDRDDLIPFEKKSFLEKVHENYLKLCKGDRFITLDATKYPEELVDICVDDILS